MDIELTNKQKIKVTGSADIFKIMQQILLRDNKVDREKEHLWTISLSPSNIILDVELISLGSFDATAIEPMNVFRVAVMKDASRLILCRNYPGERLVASRSDKDITDRLIQVGNILNIEVIDHLIITTKDYMSFADTGLMEELAKSVNWVPGFELVEKIRREEAKIRRQMLKEAKEKAAIKEAKAVNKKALEMAKGMKRKGYPIEDIVEISGLTQKEVEAIKM